LAFDPARLVLGIYCSRFKLLLYALLKSRPGSKNQKYKFAEIHLHVTILKSFNQLGYCNKCHQKAGTEFDVIKITLDAICWALAVAGFNT